MTGYEHHFVVGSDLNFRPGRSTYADMIWTLSTPRYITATGISQNKVYQVNLDWGVLYNQFMFQTSIWVYIYYPSEQMHLAMAQENIKFGH